MRISDWSPDVCSSDLFYRQYYRPSRTTVFAVGDFDVDAMEAKIKAQFADWQPKEPDGPEPDLGNIAPQQLQTHVYVEGSLTPSVSISWTNRSEEHTSELTSLMRISYAVFCLNKKYNNF